MYQQRGISGLSDAVYLDDFSQKNHIAATDGPQVCYNVQREKLLIKSGLPATALDRNGCIEPNEETGWFKLLRMVRLCLSQSLAAS
jgi:hypothetical protein